MTAIFRNLSIKRKLVFMAMVSCLVALLLTASTFTVYEVISFRRSVSHELTTIAQMLAENSTAALAFNDSAAAQETLAALKAEPRIAAAAILRPDGRVFARYTRTGQKPGQASPGSGDGAYFRNGHLEVYQSARVDGDRVGIVYLKSDMEEIQSRLVQYSGIALGVLIIGSLVALLVASKLQRLISRPILNLAETASLVSMERNYSARAQKSSNDEMGILVDRFNEMMAHIQSRDTALQMAQDELEDRVEERTKDLQTEIAERKKVQEDLLTAKQAAEESNRAKSAFLANMSHELRTPLNAIIGYSEMLLEDAEAEGDAQIAADLAKIRQAGRHLLMLINDVLDLSKIEAGKMDLHLELFPTSDIVREAQMTIEPLARKNGNRLIVRNDDPEGMVFGDSIRFKQSLFNLLSNACKFTENGTVTLSVRRDHSGGSEWVYWAVTDTGIGIAPGDIEKLFLSFSQVDNSSTRRYQGTGLGLAISQRLCRLMGGNIEVSSEVGRGSTFTIQLPGNRESGPQKSEERPAGEPQKQPHGHILLIEPTPDLKLLSEELLGKAGYEIVTAADGEEALALARRSIPTSIVLTIRTPGLDGWTLLQTLKADPFLGKVPVLLHTVPRDNCGDTVTESAETADAVVAVIRRHSQSRPPLGPNTAVFRDAMDNLCAEFPRLTPIEHGGLGLARVARLEDQGQSLLLSMVVPGTPGFEMEVSLSKNSDWQTLPVVSVAVRKDAPHTASLERLLGQLQKEATIPAVNPAVIPESEDRGSA